jgi:hypothetical protein
LHCNGGGTANVQGWNGLLNRVLQSASLIKVPLLESGSAGARGENRSKESIR